MSWSRSGPVLFSGDRQLVGLMVDAEHAERVIAAVNALAAPPPAAMPSAVLDLHPWKLQLPEPKEGGGVREVLQPELGSYVHASWFRATERLSVRFRAPTSGATTSGSKYPRCELREMKGIARAAWATNVGGHHLEIDQAITAAPRGKPHVVAGQIHDASDDVMMIRLEERRLFVEVGGDEVALLDPAYELGRRFKVHFWAGGGKTKVFYNDEPSPRYTLMAVKTGCYFKAGAYTQSNADTERAAGQVAGEDNFGEVEIYSLAVRHG